MVAERPRSEFSFLFPLASLEMFLSSLLFVVPLPWGAALSPLLLWLMHSQGLHVVTSVCSAMLAVTGLTAATPGVSSERAAAQVTLEVFSLL